MRLSEEGPSRSGFTHQPSEDSSEDSVNARDAVEPPSSPPRTQYDLMRDGHFEHLQYEAQDDQRATQRLRSRTNVLSHNTVAENGILESVTCVNFMCHERLHCELGPLLNFIVGENGSGKSAILTAITLCLGGKASSTNRGGSLKAFVKEGQERAMLAVKIKNRGHDAFKPELYGDSVIVERHFSKSGASGFKVKSATGVTISTKKQEVEELVEYYALQVDNPLNILSQDNARSFLNSANKYQKYKFFIEGVQLQQLDNDYRLIAENLDMMVSKIPDQEEMVNRAREDFEKAKRLRESLEGARRIRAKAKVVRAQLAWIQVENEERELQKQEEKLNRLNEHIAQTDREIEEQAEALARADQQIAQAEELISEVKQEQDDVKRRSEQARDELNRLRGELEKLHSDERDANENLKRIEEDIQKKEEEIGRERKRLESKNNGQHAAKLKELEEAKVEVANLGQKLKEVNERRPELIKAIDETNKKLEQIDKDVTSKRVQIDKVENSIRNLETSRGSPYDAYERGVAALVKRIDQDNGFRDKPIGPLGAYLRLTEPRWSYILEATLGGSLNAFLVTNNQDQKRLSAMMNELNVRHCPILICNPRPLDLTGKEPDPEYNTILRVLRIDNIMVRDQLIINHAIEQILLVPERVRAEQIMFDGARPRNARACLALHDTRPNEGIRLTVNTGGPSTSPVQPDMRQKPRIQTDSDAQLNLQREALQRLRAELNALESEQRRLRQASQHATASLHQFERERLDLERKIRNAKALVETLTAELEDLTSGDTGHLNGLEQVLKDLEKQRELVGMQFGTLALQKQEKNREVEDARKKRAACRKEEEEVESKLKKAETKLQKRRDIRQVVLIEKNNLHERLDKLNRDKAELEDVIQETTRKLEAMSAEARTVAAERPAIPPGETHSSLEQKYASLDRHLRKLEKDRGKPEEEIHAEYAKATEAYEKAVQSLESTKLINQRLQQSLTQRLAKWRKFQRYISSQSRANFIYLLSERGFRGKLLLDHKRKALDLVVEPDQTQKQAAARSTKTLSGGEKSFSSICLLLAIWEAMGSPLRCLDEFDVFMDNVNRAISTNMLVRTPPNESDRRFETDLRLYRSRRPVARSIVNTSSSRRMPLRGGIRSIRMSRLFGKLPT